MRSFLIFLSVVVAGVGIGFLAANYLLPLIPDLSRFESRFLETFIASMAGLFLMGWIRHIKHNGSKKAH